MGNYKNRLQFVHHDELFSTREDAMNYVNGQLIQIDRPALYAEPMILKYGDEEEPNIILAIGSVGNGETMSTNNKVFFIDLANIEESIEKLNGQVEDVKNVKELVSAIIASCGLNEDGTYSIDLDDDILRDKLDLFLKERETQFSSESLHQLATHISKSGIPRNATEIVAKALSQSKNIYYTTGVNEFPEEYKDKFTCIIDGWNN